MGAPDSRSSLVVPREHARLHPVFRRHWSPTRGRRSRHIDAVVRATQTPGQERGDSRRKGFQVDGLGEEYVPQGGLICWRQLAGCHHHWNLRKCRVKLQPLAQAYAIHSRHVPVSNNQIWEMAPRYCQGWLTAPGKQGAMTASLENQPKHPQRFIIVVDQQDGSHSADNRNILILRMKHAAFDNCSPSPVGAQCAWHPARCSHVACGA